MDFIDRPNTRSSVPPLWEHQDVALRISQEHDRRILAHGIGTGKTRTILEIFLDKCKDREKPLKGLLITKSALVEESSEDINKFLENDTRSKLCQIIPLAPGTPTLKRLERIKEGLKDDCNTLFIINFEAFDNKKLYEFVRTKFLPELVMVDEAHNIRSTGSKRAQKVYKICHNKNSRYVYLLSGGFFINSYEDLYIPIKAVDIKALPKNKTEFLLEYFEDENSRMPRGVHFPKWVIKPSKGAELKKLFHSVAHVVRRDEVLKDLPDVVEKTVMVKLPEKLKGIYKTLEKDFVVLLEDKEISTDLVITNLIRLRQVCNGLLKFDEGEEEYIQTNKEKALEELLEVYAQNGQIIIWADKKECYEQVERVARKLGLSFGRIVGGQKKGQRGEDIKAFKSGEKKVLLCNPISAGAGFNFQNAAFSIYYSLSWSLEEFDQSCGRNLRAGSEIHDKIHRTFIVTEDTLEEKILKVVREKKQLSDLLLEF